MNYIIEKPLPSDTDLMLAAPLMDTDKTSICAHRSDIKNILRGLDKRVLLIIGPCSAWPEAAVLEYATRLRELAHDVQDTVKIVMRVYPQKPRTIVGWMGSMYHPNPLSTPDIAEGLKHTREMMLQVIRLGLPIASEAVFTSHRESFTQLLSWLAIGARSSEDQERRIFASSLDIPVGLKNPRHGVLDIGVHSIIAAQRSHTSVLDGHQIRTLGNPYAHLVLRGGNNKPNYSIPHLEFVQQAMRQHNISHPSVLIDASHDNCSVNGVKNHRLQPQIIQDVLTSLQTRDDLRFLVKGFMLESFIKDGNQAIDCDQMDTAGLSITDPCLGWEETADCVKQVAGFLRNMTT